MKKDLNSKKPGAFMDAINRALGFIDNIVLLCVIVGIIAAAVMLLFEAASDFVHYDEHSISHVISDLLFVLIIMELFRQVLRQLNLHPFSLNPFIFIGIIASIRGMLLIQMMLGMGEADWKRGAVQLCIYAVIILILMAAYYINNRIEKDKGLLDEDSGRG